MPINIDDNDFPASYDDTLNLVQIVKSQAHLLKKITGKASWENYPTNNLEQLNTAMDNLAANIDSIDSQLSDYTSQGRPRILWKTPRFQTFNVGAATTTFYTIVIPAGTCSVDSILRLHLNVHGGNTATAKTLGINLSGISIGAIGLSSNTWYTLMKPISFDGSLSSPRTTATGTLGTTNSAAAIQSVALNFAQEQTLFIRGSSGGTSEAITVLNGYLELI